MDWADRLRKTTGVFTWWIHHNRKASGDNKRPNKLADVYGSQYITARATTVIGLWDSGTFNSLSLIPLKLRLAKKPEPFLIYRDDLLKFSHIKGDSTSILPNTPKLLPDTLALEVVSTDPIVIPEASTDVNIDTGGL